MAALHAETMSDALFARIGLGFLECLYAAILRSPRAFYFVWQEADLVIGFIGASPAPARLIRDALWTAPLALGKHVAGFLVRHPEALPELWETFCFETLADTPHTSGGEMLHIAIEPAYRGDGRSHALVEAACQALAQAGCERVRVATFADHRGACDLLESSGFHVARTIPFRGRPKRIYVRGGDNTDMSCGFGRRLRLMLRREILIAVPIYLLVLIPFATLLAYLSMAVDRALGLGNLATWLPLPLRLAICIACLLSGAAMVGWCYTYLVLEGGGGPVPPFSEQTSRLVTCGPYAVVRHPSIWGKLLGIFGLGVLVGSPTFLLVVIPLLLWWSLECNMKRQDRHMEALFGESFVAYRDRTPRFLPNLGRRETPSTRK